MTLAESGYTPQQTILIAKLKELLQQMADENIHIVGVTHYEALIQGDADGKPYIAIM